MRTESELQSFAKECMQIEKRGGDVLEYIAEKFPSYTPRATWYKLQSIYLGRRANQLTEGTPKKKGGETMGRMMEVAKGAVEAYNRGEDVTEWMLAQGIKNPNGYMYQIKSKVQNDPELYEKISEIHLTIRKPKAVTTCCVESMRNGVEVPDVLPDEEVPGEVVECSSPLEIMAIRSEVTGKYEKTSITDPSGEKLVSLMWQDVVTRSLSSLTLTVKDWKRLSEEIPKAMEQLGC